MAASMHTHHDPFHQYSVMGYDLGFDLSPPLKEDSGDASDQQVWSMFLDDVLKRYKHDPVIKATRFYIDFDVGEVPQLPRQGSAFRRFSSKISNKRLQRAEPYIQEVFRLAHKRFGDRVKLWNELFDDYGVYGWREVYAAREQHERYLEQEQGKTREDNPTHDLCGLSAEDWELRFSNAVEKHR